MRKAAWYKIPCQDWMICEAHLFADMFLFNTNHGKPWMVRGILAAAKTPIATSLLSATISFGFWSAVLLGAGPSSAADNHGHCRDGTVCPGQATVKEATDRNWPDRTCLSSSEHPACGGDRTIWVDKKTGDDRHTGLSPDDAVKSLGRAAELVKGGDVMIIRPGVYYETPAFKDLESTASKPVWILSEMPGQAVISGLWEEADRGEVHWSPIGDGIYAADHGDSFMGEALGRFLFRYKSLADLRANRVIGIKKPRYGFAHEEGTLYLRLPGDADPNGISVKLTDRFKQPIITIKNAPHVILDGFGVTGAGDSDAIVADRSSHHLTLRNLVVTQSRRAAKLPDHSLFEWSEYSYPGFYQFVDDLIDLNPDKTTPIYDLVKRYFNDRGNAYLEGGIAESFETPSEHVEFRYLYIHQVFDGQRLGAFNNSRSHHNICAYVYDDCIEFAHWRPTHPAINLHVHDSLILNVTGSAAHQNSLGSMQGPHFVYRNVVYNTNFKHARPPYLVKNKGLQPSHRIIYHHNLLQNWKGPSHGWGPTNWLYWDNKDGAPEHLTFKNNIFLFDDLTDHDYKRDPTSDNNILINASDVPDMRGDDGLYLGKDASVLGLANRARLDFGLRENSPAIDAGADLPSDWPDSRKVDGKPDIGPFEFGDNPGPNWPRPRRTVFTETPPKRWR